MTQHVRLEKVTHQKRLRTNDARVISERSVHRLHVSFHGLFVGEGHVALWAFVELAVPLIGPVANVHGYMLHQSLDVDEHFKADPTLVDHLLLWTRRLQVR